jgi:hypothetical protein
VLDSFGLTAVKLAVVKAASANFFKEKQKHFIWK